MSEPYVGEIIAVGFNYATNTCANFVPCNGQQLQVQQYTALFSLIGNYYGGNGTTNFNLPNLNAQVAVSQGQGPGLTNRTLGETVGVDQVTLTTAQIPPHNHQLQLGKSGAPNATPGPGSPGTTAVINPVFNGFVSGPADASLSANAIGLDGGGQPHPNRQPNTALMYMIATTGIYPPFN